MRLAGYQPRDCYEADSDLRAAIDAVADGQFSAGDRDRFRPLLNSLLQGDEYFVMADFAAYKACQSLHLSRGDYCCFHGSRPLIHRPFTPIDETPAVRFK